MLRPPKRKMTISFRVGDPEYERLLRLKGTFDDPTWAEVFHWMLEQPGVGQAIAKRVETTPPLPIGPADPIEQARHEREEERRRNSAWADLGNA